MRPLRPISQRGVTLVEVLIALTILAVILLPVVVAFRQSLTTTNEATLAAAASSVAREKIEELKIDAFDALQTQPREPRDLKPGDGFFEIAVAVETIRPDDISHAGLKKLQVSVYRTGGAVPLAILTSYTTPFGI